MDTFLQDIRYGARMLLRKPGVMVAALLSLALGIGANATVYTWVRAVLFEPLPGVESPNDVVVSGTTTMSGTRGPMSYPDFLDYNAGSREVLEGMLVFGDSVEMALGVANPTERPERLWGNLVSGNYFDVLGVKAILGRTFLPEEDQTSGAHPVVVLSHSLWKRRFSGDPAIVGRTVSLNGLAFTVIGVTPESFMGTELGLMTDLWAPLMMTDQILQVRGVLDRRENRWLLPMARLKPGVTNPQAAAALDVIAKQLAAAYPDTNKDRTAFVSSVWNSYWGAPAVLLPMLSVLSVVVALVLLIAWANVANLMLAHALTRRSEILVRLSLGASRLRLVRQHLTESLLLAIGAGCIGLLIGYWTSGTLMALLPATEAPIHVVLGIERSAVLFTVAVSILSGLAFGIVPAIYGANLNFLQGLKDESGNVTSSRSKSRLRRLLVVTQVAASLLLLVTAGLFVRSVLRAEDLDPGFSERNAFLAEYDLSTVGYTEERGLLLHRQLLERVRELPSVRSATFATAVPLEMDNPRYSPVLIEGYQEEKDEQVSFQYNVVGPDYFKTLQIPVVEGRDFAFGDTRDSESVVVINETAAKRYWPAGNALGSRIRVLGNTWARVAGIVKDGKYHTLTESPGPYMYLSGLQSYMASMDLHVATYGEPTDLIAAVRDQVRSLDPNLPLFEIKTFEQHLQTPVFVQRLAGTLLSTMGLLALLLASVGLYGVIAYAAAERTREVGIRLAFGARRGDIVRMILGGGLSLALIGIGLGLALALTATRVLEGQLIGVSTTDPVVFVGVSLLLASIAALASYIPARKAARTDPAIALKHE